MAGAGRGGVCAEESLLDSSSCGSSWEEAAYEPSGPPRRTAEPRVVLVHRVLALLVALTRRRRVVVAAAPNDYEAARAVLRFYESGGEEAWRLQGGSGLAQYLSWSVFPGFSYCAVPVKSEMAQFSDTSAEDEISLFISLNLSGVQARLYVAFDGAGLPAGFVEHQVGTTVVAQRKMAAGCVLGIDFVAAESDMRYSVIVSDQTAIFGSKIRYHRLFLKIVKAVQGFLDRAGVPTGPGAQHLRYFSQLDEERLAALPSTLAALRVHPRLVTEAHCHRNETIFPKRTQLGTVKGHAVYPASALLRLRTAAGWYRQGRVLLPGQKPYRIVKTGDGGGQPKRSTSRRSPWRGDSSSVRDESTVKRLYAPFQTEPLRVHGLTSDRMDYFHPNFLPEGYEYVRSGAEFCALLGIPFAECVVGFHWERDPLHGAPVCTPQVQGCFIPQEYCYKLNTIVKEAEHHAAVRQLVCAFEESLREWRQLLARAERYFEVLDYVSR